MNLITSSLRFLVVALGQINVLQRMSWKGKDMAYSNQQKETTLRFFAPVHMHRFLFSFVTRGGWNVSAEAILHTAFKAIFERNKWSYADCINCSHNFMWNLRSVMFSVSVQSFEIFCDEWVRFTYWIWKPADSWPEVHWSYPQVTFHVFFLPIFFLTKGLWGGLGLCWDVCIALWKKHSLPAEAHSPEYCLFTQVCHFHYIISLLQRKPSLEEQDSGTASFATAKLLFL